MRGSVIGRQPLPSCLSFLGAHSREWDVLDLEGLVETAAVTQFLNQFPGRYLAREPIRCPYIALPPNWEAYENERLSANRRQQLRRRQRMLERDYSGQVEYHQVSDAGELPEALDVLIDLTKERWHERGLASSFDGDCFVAFNRAFALGALRNGWLRFYQLKVAGRVIATEYNFLYRGVFSNYKKGFDLTWEKYSPGQIMHAYIIQRAIEEGAQEFDMLQGPHDVQVFLDRPGAPGWAPGHQHQLAGACLATERRGV